MERERYIYIYIEIDRIEREIETFIERTSKMEKKEIYNRERERKREKERKRD